MRLLRRNWGFIVHPHLFDALVALMRPDLRLTRYTADKAAMGAIVVEQISPELVLVCPELREGALAALPDMPWLMPNVKERPRSLPSSTQILPRPAVFNAAAYVASRLFPPLVAVASCILATLVLTFIADATR
jgi:hypothetical protein